MSDSSMYFSIYDATDSTLCCALSSAYSQPSNTTQIEFTQLFEDGSIINVNNNPLFDIYPKWDKKSSYRFPNANSFDELFTVAKTIVDNMGRSAKLGLQKGNEFSSIEEHLTDELQRLVFHS
jgi:hypothetical protein